MPHKNYSERLAYQKQYRQKHKERRRIQIRQWQDRNREKLLAYWNTYNANRREAQRAFSKAYYKRNKARCAAKNAKYRASNREALLKKKRAYHAAHRDAIAVKHREAYRRNPALYCSKASEYAKRNPHIRVLRARRRHKRIETTVEQRVMIAKFVKRLRQAKAVRCYYCKRTVSGKRAHVEHMTPLAAGGTHEIGNLCVACQHCNQTKHVKTLAKWQPESPQPLLAL